MNEDFNSLNEVIGYLTILWDSWKEESMISESEAKEEKKHFDNAIKFIKNIERGTKSGE